MERLETETNRFGDADAAYRMLIEAHRGLSDEQSVALNTRLVLILANRLGDLALLAQAIRLAADAGSMSESA